MISCQTCDCGFYCPKGSVSPTPVGHECPVDHFCPAGTSAPIACPSGGFTLGLIGQCRADCCKAGPAPAKATPDTPGVAPMGTRTEGQEKLAGKPIPVGYAPVQPRQHMVAPMTPGHGSTGAQFVNGAMGMPTGMPIVSRSDPLVGTMDFAPHPLGMHGGSMAGAGVMRMGGGEGPAGSMQAHSHFIGPNTMSAMRPQSYLPNVISRQPMGQAFPVADPHGGLFRFRQEQQGVAEEGVEEGVYSVSGHFMPRAIAEAEENTAGSPEFDRREGDARAFRFLQDLRGGRRAGRQEEDEEEEEEDQREADARSRKEEEEEDEGQLRRARAREAREARREEVEEKEMEEAREKNRREEKKQKRRHEIELQHMELIEEEETQYPASRSSRRSALNHEGHGYKRSREALDEYGFHAMEPSRALAPDATSAPLSDAAGYEVQSGLADAHDLSAQLAGLW